MSAAEAERKAAFKDLRRIPGIGPSIANDLWEMGYRSVDALKGEDAQTMYDRHMAQKGCYVDRCLLYTFRCAVDFAGRGGPNPEKPQWWHWKDGA